MSAATDRFDPVMTGLIWAGNGIAAVWLVMSLTYPFGWDQGLFSWVADAIVRGGLPYRDAWDIKGPLLYYLYGLAQWLFGVHLWGIRVLDAAFLGLGTVALMRTVATLADRRTAQFAATLFVLWYASHSYWHTAQPDAWAGMLLMVGVGPLLGASAAGVPALVTAGLCLGLAALLKPLWLVFIALPLLAILLSGWPNPVRASLVVVGGWLLPIVLTIAWFAAHGALNDLIDVHLKYSALYVGLASDDRLKSLAQYFLANRITTVALPIAIYGVTVLWTSRRPAAVVLLVWVAATIALVTWQGRFYAYHWLPLLPAMTTLVAVGLREVSLRTRALAQITAAILFVSCSAPVLLEAARFAAWSVGALDRHAYYDAYGEPGADMKAIEWLQTSAGPGKVFGFGFHCGVPWLGGRESVSRFCYALPLMMGESAAIRSQYRAEVLTALNADPPRYIVVGVLSEQILGTAMTMTDFPELNEWVHRRYREVARFGTISILENGGS